MPQLEGLFVSSLLLQIQKVNAFYREQANEVAQSMERIMPLINQGVIFGALRSEPASRRPRDVLQQLVTSPRVPQDARQALALFLHLGDHLNKVRRFALVNFLAVVKVVKKHDKLSLLPLRSAILSFVAVQPFHLGDPIYLTYTSMRNLSLSLAAIAYGEKVPALSPPPCMRCSNPLVMGMIYDGQLRICPSCTVLQTEAPVPVSGWTLTIEHIFDEPFDEFEQSRGGGACGGNGACGSSGDPSSSALLAAQTQSPTRVGRFDTTTRNGTNFGGSGLEPLPSAGAQQWPQQVPPSSSTMSMAEGGGEQIHQHLQPIAIPMVGAEPHALGQPHAAGQPHGGFCGFAGGAALAQPASGCCVGAAPMPQPPQAAAVPIPAGMPPPPGCSMASSGQSNLVWGSSGPSGAALPSAAACSAFSEGLGSMTSVGGVGSGMPQGGMSGLVGAGYGGMNLLGGGLCGPSVPTSGGADPKLKKWACTECHKAKTACEGNPCRRCQRLGKVCIMQERPIRKGRLAARQGAETLVEVTDTTADSDAYRLSGAMGGGTLSTVGHQAYAAPLPPVSAGFVPSTSDMALPMPSMSP